MRLRSDSDGMINPPGTAANLTSSEHSDTNMAEIGSLEDSNSHKATGGANTPISQRRLYKRIPRNPISMGYSTDNQSLKSKNSYKSLPTIAEESKEKRIRQKATKRMSGGFTSAFDRYKIGSSCGEEDQNLCLEGLAGESNTSSSSSERKASNERISEKHENSPSGDSLEARLPAVDEQSMASLAQDYVAGLMDFAVASARASAVAQV